jgi:hypothetical protein
MNGEERFALWFRARGGLWVELHRGTLSECEREEWYRRDGGFRGEFQILPSGRNPLGRVFAPNVAVGAVKVAS